jgi:hypothetical protein
VTVPSRNITTHTHTHTHTHHPINQSINQWINESINESTNQSMNWFDTSLCIREAFCIDSRYLSRLCLTRVLIQKKRINEWENERWLYNIQKTQTCLMFIICTYVRIYLKQMEMCFCWNERRIPRCGLPLAKGGPSWVTKSSPLLWIICRTTSRLKTNLHVTLLKSQEW